MYGNKNDRHISYISSHRLSQLDGIKISGPIIAVPALLSYVYLRVCQHFTARKDGSGICGQDDKMGELRRAGGARDGDGDGFQLGGN
jgi:hypothetical protein